MTSYEIQLYGTANAELGELPSDERNDLVDEIKNIAENPSPLSDDNVAKLDMAEDLFRLKIGRYRVIFGQVQRYLIIVRIGCRGSRVYDNIDHVQSIYDEARSAVKNGTF